jgi:hypothetical protein
MPMAYRNNAPHQLKGKNLMIHTAANISNGSKQATSNKGTTTTVCNIIGHSQAQALQMPYHSIINK